MIYTSYFGCKKWKDMPSVSIARWAPKGISIQGYPMLYPPSDLLWSYKQGQIDQEQYTEWYKKEVLDKLDPKQVYEDLNGKVLLCYEKSGAFCHRNIVASWLREAGFSCEELGEPHLR